MQATEKYYQDKIAALEFRVALLEEELQRIKSENFIPFPG